MEVDVFKEFVVNDLRQRGNVTTLNDIASHAVSANGETMYMSVYDFDKSYKKYVEENNSVAGFDGEVTVSKLYFDIDKGKNNSEITDEQCLNKARSLIYELQNDWELDQRYIQPWFSGRGYHIVTPDFFGFGKGADVPDKVKHTLTHYFKDIDPVIYDKTRLIRLGNSKHEESKLYKIPLSVGEIMVMTPDEIHALAADKRKGPRWALDWSDFEPLHQEKIKTAPVQQSVAQTTTNYTTNDTEIPSPSAFMTCCQTIYNNGPQKGSRHRTNLVLASWLRRSGLPQNLVGDILTSWFSDYINDPNDRMTDKEVLRGVKATFEKPYFFWCNNDLMKAHCTDKCVYFTSRENDTQFKSNQDISPEFMEWFMNFDYSNSLNIGSFAGVHDWWVNPSELIIISGDSGAGKSAFVQNLILYSGLKTAYYQMEMGEQLDRLRFNKMHFNMSDDKLREYFKTMSPNERIESQRIFDNIFTKSACPDINKLKKEIALIEPKIVVVDTMDMIHSNARGQLEKERDIAVQLKNLANQLDVIVIAIAHKKKSASDRTSEHYNNLKESISGSGAIFQKADKVLFVSSPSGDYKPDRLITSAKNRNEGILRAKMMFWGSTMHYEKAVLM